MTDDTTLPVCVLDARWRTPWDGDGPAGMPHDDDGSALAAAMIKNEDRTRHLPRGSASTLRAYRLVEPIASWAVACGIELARALAVAPSDRLGLYAGHGGLRSCWRDLWTPMRRQHRDAADSWQLGLGRIHPLWMLRFLSNNAHGILAAEVGARGEGAVCSGPLGGAEALMMAQAALVDGAIDHALVICYDVRSSPEVVLDRRRVGDLRLGVDCAVALLLAPAAAAPGSPRLSITTEMDSAAPDASERSWRDRVVTPTDRFAALDTGAVAPALTLALAVAGKRWQPRSTGHASTEHCYIGTMGSRIGVRARLRVAVPTAMEAAR
jgi:hypothetical protein